MVLALVRCRTAISFIVAALLAHTPARSAMKGYKMILKKKYRFCLGCYNIKDFHLSVCSITRTQPISAPNLSYLCIKYSLEEQTNTLGYNLIENIFVFLLWGWGNSAFGCREISADVYLNRGVSAYQTRLHVRKDIQKCHKDNASSEQC